MTLVLSHCSICGRAVPIFDENGCLLETMAGKACTPCRRYMESISKAVLDRNYNLLLNRLKNGMIEPRVFKRMARGGIFDPERYLTLRGKGEALISAIREVVSANLIEKKGKGWSGESL